MDSVLFQTGTIPKPVPGAGVGLFATNSFDIGSTICVLPTSFATVLETPQLQNRCSNCFGCAGDPSYISTTTPGDGSLKACTGCKVVKYCDKICQSENWKVAHKYECGIYKSMHPHVLPTNSRAVLRIVLLKAAKKLSQGDLEIFEKQLQSHIKDIERTDQKRFQMISLSAEAVRTYSKTNLSLETLRDYFGKLEINGFTLTTPWYDSCGLSVEPYVALLNHSCDPNAVVGFDQGRIFVKALRPIKEGEQIFISYIDSTNPFAVRQKSLLDRYFFNCTCSKCAKGTAAREDKFLTPNPDMSDLINAEQPAAEVLASIEAGCSWADAVTKLTAAMDSLKETGVWPITRQPFVQLRDELSFYLLAEKQFGPAFVQLAIRHLKVDPVIFPGPWHPLRNVHAWTLVKVAILLFQPLQKSGVNLGLIIYSLLRTLNESASYELPTASREYKDTYEGARKEFIDNGLDPDNMEADLRAEWANLERLLDEPSMWATLSPLSPEELSAL